MKTMVATKTVKTSKAEVVYFIKGEKYEVSKPASIKKRVNEHLKEFKSSLPPEKLKHWSAAVEEALVYMYTNDEKRKGDFYLVTGKLKRFNGKVKVYVNEEVPVESCSEYLKEI